MTEQEKTFIAREFDKLENQLDSKYALYENGYQSGLFDALEVVNKLPIHNVVFSEAELKAKLEEQKEEIRQWLIDEDFEGLAECL